MLHKSFKKIMAVKALSVIGASLIAMTTFSAHAQSYLDKIKERGVIKVGIVVDFPPYGITNAANKPDGYDADVARLLAKYLGVKLDLIPVTGPNRIPYLLTDKTDVLVASLAITPERVKQVQFSKPYSAASMVLLAPTATPIKTPADFVKYKIGVPRAGTADIGLMKVVPKGTDIRRFDDDASSLQALIVGQVDAAGTSSVIAGDVQKRYPGKYQIKYVINEQVMGITMQYKRPELLDAVNKFIKVNVDNGELNKLFTKWINVPLPQSVVAASDK
ncbi:transporter substrate-binding domain-containing protein [Paralcaligenes ureilyticus]|uniref:Amino acid ABC transporter substrate-binding protein (PAAT family) n=1 Tax=Paralcaligenes ureilyticus TaxID=627131 RepID=A0A4R3MCN0_9BURK|nr:transporter substrate-binding domain-containing protein [Paralcaligenes ureilyticus]TCT09777.1 amino acid ABC transporter substrate-binding protein (PAAT family) [Paralcaligenes ureilyticus]